MPTLILIHGINNENNSSANIRENWVEALQEGGSRSGRELPVNLNVRAAFYGDLLAKETDSWRQSSDAVSSMSAESPPSDYVDHQTAALYKALQDRAKITDDTIRSKLDPEDLREADPQADGIHKKWIKAIARALEDILPTRGRYVAKLFLKQAAAYLHKPDLKEKIDTLVYEQVFKDIPTGDKTVVIGHSLGTIVSYDILRIYEEAIKVNFYLTAGSPLGIDIVKDVLGPPLIRPDNVKRWMNISDKEDFVALHPALNEETFGPAIIENITDIDNGDEDAHDIHEYLRHEEPAKAVLDALA